MDGATVDPLRRADGTFAPSPEGSSVYNRKQYPSNYRSGVLEEVLDANTIQEGPSAGKVLTADGKIVSRDDSNLTIKHDYAIVDHWNDIGYNSPRSVRSDFYNGTEN